MCIVSNTYRIGKVRIESAADRIVPALPGIISVEFGQILISNLGEVV